MGAWIRTQDDAKRIDIDKVFQFSVEIGRNSFTHNHERYENLIFKATSIISTVISTVWVRSAGNTTETHNRILDELMVEFVVPNQNRERFYVVDGNEFFQKKVEKHCSVVPSAEIMVIQIEAYQERYKSLHGM